MIRKVLMDPEQVFGRVREGAFDSKASSRKISSYLLLTIYTHCGKLMERKEEMACG